MELRIENISKTYSNGVRALDGVSLTIPTGMFGLVGPNGSGKTTLMRTIATLQEPDAGSAHLGDIDVLADKESVRRVLGYLPQEFGVYPNLTAETLLTHIATLKGMTNPRERKEVVEAMLQRTNLWNDRKKKLGGFSGGMRQRFGIAQALLGDPKLVIVDEPTAGLDPEERNRFLNLLSEIGENIIVILSTHIVDDVAEVCNSMAIIRDGQVLRTGAPQEAIEGIRGRTWKKTIDKSELPDYERDHRVVSKRLRGGRTIIHVLADGRPDPSFDGADPDLEDVYFITLTRANGRNGSGTAGRTGAANSSIESAGGHTTGTASGGGR
ncbi:MAG: ABC transporter ATP-binding protein [Candidatus Eisenbacteria bacterium]